MAVVRVVRYFEATAGSRRITGGSLYSSYDITTQNDSCLDDCKVLASGGAVWTAWSASSSDPLTSFSFLWIESSIDGVEVELTCDANSTYGREEMAFVLKANAPLMLVGNKSLANYTAGFASGTVDVIDQIRIRNPLSTGADATVRVVLI